MVLRPSRLGLKNTPIAILQEDKNSPNKCPGYNSKQSDGEIPVMLELWGMQVPLCCHRYLVHSGPEWEHLIESYLWVK